MFNLVNIIGMINCLWLLVGIFLAIFCEISLARWDAWGEG